MYIQNKIVGCDYISFLLGPMSWFLFCSKETVLNIKYKGFGFCTQRRNHATVYSMVRPSSFPWSSFHCFACKAILLTISPLFSSFLFIILGEVCFVSYWNLFVVSFLNHAFSYCFLFSWASPLSLHFLVLYLHSRSSSVPWSLWPETFLSLPSPCLILNRWFSGPVGGCHPGTTFPVLSLSTVSASL